MTSQEKAERLLALHHAGDPLIFINAWDAVSARIVEGLGFPAIATTSAGIAWTEGYPDGERITREDMLSRVRCITRAVHVPVSADLEAAYGTTEDDAIATARGAIEAGAVGLNFEDATDGPEPLMDIEAQCRRIGAMRRAADESGVHLVINARTDPFLKQVGDSNAWRLSESVRRGERYLQAGADCIFVPGVSDEAMITALVRDIHGPVNILAAAAMPPISRLKAIGVARISAGSGAMGHALAQFRAVARTVLANGTFDFAGDRIINAELNALFKSLAVS